MQIPILPDNSTEMENYLCRQELPCKYMEDFSLLGFVAESFEAALVLLAEKGFEVHRHDSGAKIDISSPSEIVVIHDLLSTHGINFSYRDIAETIYQA